MKEIVTEPIHIDNRWQKEIKDGLAPEGDEYIYLLRMENGICKLGNTINPTARLRTHLYNLKPYTLLYLAEVSNMEAMESRLQHEFREKKIKGADYFKLDEMDVLRFIDVVRNVNLPAPRAGYGGHWIRLPIELTEWADGHIRNDEYADLSHFIKIALEEFKNKEKKT